jgi:tetratricopeptide (TPR) repeat protein
MSDLSDFIRRVYEPETKALQEKLLRAEREIAAGNEKHLVLWRRWQDAEARAQKAEAEAEENIQEYDRAIKMYEEVRDRSAERGAQLVKAEAERDAALELTYRTRYGYPLKWALVAEFFWRVEHLPWPGCLHRWGYRMRKASEHRGGSGQGHG